MLGTAAQVFQQLATGTTPGSSERAGSLIKFSNRFGDLGRREEALATIEEATTAYRALAQARPDASLPDLAGSLTNQSGRLADLGRWEEALAAAEEAATIRHTLAQGRLARSFPTSPRC